MNAPQSAIVTPLTTPTRPDQNVIAYRPDIDGLRAIAVLAVVFNHIGFRGFHGGFVGVDVFFVISGYLITGIIWKELGTGRFTLATFYRRRILRILPAFYATLAAVIVAGVVWLLPSELERLVSSAFASELFSSNVFFYFGAGYFAPTAGQEPLLHTWSLAVEEQFYVFWPLILWAVHRTRAQPVVAVTVLIALVSFAVSIGLLWLDATANFYLIPSRAWELAIGALIALAPSTAIAQRWLRESIAIVGLLFIAAAVKVYTERTPFPGPTALLPCIGTALLIAVHGSGSTIVGRLLSTPPAVWFGKISFSLYLWHWPVVVFAAIGLLLEPSPLVMAGELATSVAAAWLSWRFVEQPFRRGAPSRMDSARLLPLTAVFIGGALVMTGSLRLLDGLPGRFDPAARGIATYATYDGDAAYRGGRCFSVGEATVYDYAACLVRRPDHRAVLLLGDSHGAHLWPGFDRVYGRGVDVLQATATGCRPVIRAPEFGEPPCRGFFRDMLGPRLRAAPVDRVVLAGRWTESDLPDLAATLAELKGRAEVLVIGPIPQYTTGLPRLLARDAAGSGRLAGDHLVGTVRDLDRRMAALVTAAGVRYASLFDLLCAPAGCRTLAADGVPMQFDYGHLTVQGSAVVARALERFVLDDDWPRSGP